MFSCSKAAGVALLALMLVGAQDAAAQGRGKGRHNRGQARAAEVHARNAARHAEHANHSERGESEHGEWERGESEHGDDDCRGGEHRTSGTVPTGTCVDANNDGICDSQQTGTIRRDGGTSGTGRNGGTIVRPGSCVDANGDGVCDARQTGRVIYGPGGTIIRPTGAIQQVGAQLLSALLTQRTGLRLR